MTYEQIEEVAQVAAEMYGQVWAGLPHWSKEIWKEMVREAGSAEVYSEASRCAVQAVKLWINDQEGQKQAQEAPPVEKKSKKKETK